MYKGSLHTPLLAALLALLSVSFSPRLASAQNAQTREPTEAQIEMNAKAIDAINDTTANNLGHLVLKFE